MEAKSGLELVHLDLKASMLTNWTPLIFAS